jgi:hypothetical protein
MNVNEISQNAANSFNNLGQQVSAGMNNIGNSFGNMRQSLNNTLSDFSSKSVLENSTEFLESNSLIAKFVFIILVLIVFMVLLNLGVFLIVYFKKPDKQPYVIKGLISGNSSRHIKQDPRDADAIRLYRSNNENKGIEFTWAVWLKRDKVEQTDGKKYIHIFNKGEQPNDTGLVDEPTTMFGNGPGVYFYSDTESSQENKIKVVMDVVNEDLNATNSGDGRREIVEIFNLPIKRWFHLAIRCENKVVDVYVNGVITKRVTFSSVPKQNFGDVHVNSSGYDGQLSDLRYFDMGLDVFQIKNIVNSGPNLRSTDSDKNMKFDYLANSWYM